VRTLLAVLALLLLAAPVGLAQPTQLAARPEAIAPGRPFAADPGAAGAAAPAVVLDISPRQYRVVRVAVPAALGAADNVTFDVQPHDGAQVLGRTHGVLSAGRRDRAVTLTVSPSTSVPAGETLAAVVVFHGPAGEVRVPVIVRVPVRFVVALVAERPSTAARPGDRVQLRYAVRNNGNIGVRLSFAARPPERWRVRDASDAALALAPGAYGMRTLTVDVPPNADEGSVAVAVAASREGVEVGAVRLFVNVLRGGAWAVHAPRLTASFGSAFSGNGAGNQPALALTFGGALAGQRTIAGRLELVPGSRDPAALRALGALGFTQSASFLSLTSPRWSLRGGDVALPDDALTGTNVWGAGGAVGWRDSLWRADATVAQPVTGTGRYLTAAASRRLGAGALTLSASVSHLDDSSSARRSLTAATLGLSGEASTVQWDVEAGSRSWQDGSGLGALAEIRQRSETGSLLAKAVAAPGGSRAFARAEHELQLSVTRRIGRGFELGGAVWQSRDRNAAFSDLAGSGWTLESHWRVGDWLTLGSRLRHNAFDALASTVTFGTRGTELGGSATLAFGSLAVSLATATGPLSQVVALPGAPGNERSITRWTQQTGVSWSGWWGAVEADLALERNGAGLGLPGAVQTYTLGVARVPLRLGSQALTARAEWSATHSAPAAQTLHRVALGADASLPGPLVLSVSAERNEAFYGRGVRVPWVFGVRLSHAFSIRALAPGGGGVVFEDRDANGRRDPGERGVPGIVVLVDGRAQATDARGRFDAPENARVEIDPTSLPVGWIVSGADGRDLGVVPTGSLAVTLKLGTDLLGRTATVDFERLVVAVYDTAGRRWAYQPSADGRALFDALPGGAYRIEIEVPDGSSPPEVRETERVVAVSPGGEPAAMTITIMPRRARLQRIEGDGAAGGVAGRVPGAGRP
jgi:hypothetical protein